MRLHGAADCHQVHVGTLSWALYATLMLSSASCGSDSQKAGGGPLAYAASEVAVVREGPSGASLIAIVPGLRNVELIDSETGDVDVILPPQPAEDCYPVTIATGDLDGDSEIDVGIIDPVCGNWIASASRTASLEGRLWTDFAPDIAPNGYLTISDIDGDGRSDVAAGYPQGLELLTRNNESWSTKDVGFGTPPWVERSVRRLFVAAGSGQLLFQRASSFQ